MVRSNFGHGPHYLRSGIARSVGDRPHSRRVSPQVVEVSWKITNEPQENVHRGRLNVSPGFPSRDGVTAQTKETPEFHLGESQALPERPDLVRGQEAILPPVQV